ncbi:MAG: hypothetical protein ACRDQA_19955 [Nocardioidaceae bacterium]
MATKGAQTKAQKEVLPEERAGRGRVPSYTLLVLSAALTIIPLLYMISLALQSDTEIFKGEPVLWPEQPQLHNFVRLFQIAPFARFLLNSVVLALPGVQVWGCY